jgi:serpin B
MFSRTHSTLTTLASATLAGAVLIGGCVTDDNSPKTNPDAPAPTPTPQPAPAPGASAADEQTPAQTEKPEAKPILSPALSRDNARFALALYHELAAEEGNVFFSPHSISTALAMTFAGARGETANQMASTLRFTLEEAELHEAFDALARSLTEAPGNAPDQAREEGGGGLQLAIANRLWGLEGEAFLPTFTELVAQRYAGGFETVNYDNPLAALALINGWIEDQTKDRIKNLLNEGDITPPPPLILTNAIYFKGDWLTQFDPERTRMGRFAIAPEKYVDAPMMTQTTDLPFMENEQVKVLELPYAGERLSMLVILPQRGVDLAKIESALSAETINAWASELEEQKVGMSLPQWTMTQRVDLARILQKMGMKLPFSRGADFSGMNGRTNDLFIGKVIHKAFIEVNEQGSEAAAATAVIMKRTAMPQHAQFHANRPFIHLIRDRETGAILFMGRITDPTDDGSAD